ncbi:MAG: hypothetical protein JW789_01085 [Candidatus Aenigmarchaeota archaeon]|nr:hypothetical protein [Candidatus Aenigmarchaeota archaeon]
MKGAIEVSIGFLIVMVISALVMIFIMGWLNSIFPTLTRIGDYATSNAENEMMKKFSEGSDAVASTIPTKVNFAAGSEVEFIVGIKKTNEQKNSNWFKLCVVAGTNTDGCGAPEDANEEVSAAGDEESGIKFLFAPYKQIPNTGSVGRVTVLMRIPEGVEGFYNYRLYSCGAENLEEVVCEELGDSFGDTDFIVRVQ